jgi:choline dehydrogenase
VLKYFKKSEDAKLSDADEDYHGQGGMLPVTDIPFRTPIAKAFVNAASEIGMPFVDINGKSQIGVDYIQVIHFAINLSYVRRLRITS